MVLGPGWAWIVGAIGKRNTGEYKQDKLMQDLGPGWAWIGGVIECFHVLLLQWLHQVASLLVAVAVSCISVFSRAFSLVKCAAARVRVLTERVFLYISDGLLLREIFCLTMISAVYVMLADSLVLQVSIGALCMAVGGLRCVGRV